MPAGPATTAGFSRARPANFPSASMAAAPEKPTAGSGESTMSLPAGVAAEAVLVTASIGPGTPDWAVEELDAVVDSVELVEGQD